MPTIKKGVLDLADWNFKQDGEIKLTGEWIFYPAVFYLPGKMPPDKAPPPSLSVNVPGTLFSDYDSNKLFGNTGFGTYRLRILHHTDSTQISLKMGDTWSAYQVFVNGKLLAKSGTVGTDVESERFQYTHKVIVLPPTPTTTYLDIVIHISNFNASSGGMIQAPQLGETTRIHKSHLLDWAWRAFILNGLFIMSFFHFILFLFRRKDISNLLVSAYCGLWGINFAVTTTSVWMLLTIFPEFPLSILRRMDHISFYLSIPVIMYFIMALYPNEIYAKFIHASVPVYLLASLISCILPLQQAETMVVYMLATITPCLLYTFTAVTRALFHHRPGAILMFTGYIILTATAINDMLLITRLIHTVELVFIGIFIFMIFQSMAVSLRFSYAYSNIEHLSCELEKKNEELSRLNAVKDDFLADTSHELRTPLHGISGIAESLLNSASLQSSSTIRENLLLIQSSSQRLLFLINDILDYSRLKHRDIVLCSGPVDLHSLVNTVMETMRHLTMEKTVSLENTLARNLPLVLADENRLAQILYNLLGNAVKFTNEGYIRVGAKLNGSQVEVTVKDSGKGLSQEEQKRIFKAYEQGDDSFARSIGTGIGLYVTEQLVRLHGGVISVESEPGKGAAFTFTLPVAQHVEVRDISTVDTKHQIHTERSHITEEIRSSADFQILAVDDEAVNLRVLSNHLTREGMHVHLARNGETCLSLLKEHPHAYDLVLLDVNMPGMNGLEVCRKLRKTHSRQTLPVIILTARTGVQALSAGFENGANDYIEKPFSKEELLARVRLHLKLKQAYEALEDRMRMEIELEKRRHSEAEARWDAHHEHMEKLRFQFAPHFLFNALNSIRSSIIDDPNAAREMLSSLAELNRIAIERRSKTSVTLAEELEMVTLYLQLEQHRYGDYLSASVNADPDTIQISVPCFILQPLVENAVKHGKQTSQDSLDIRIDISLKANTLILSVSNSGSWIPTEAPRTGPSTGFGILHLQERLSHWNASLSYKEENSRVHVQIHIPQSIAEHTTR